MTVERLNARMRDMNLSPERLAEMVPISNMTIRRLLEKPPQTVVPDKHRAHLEPVLQMGGSFQGEQLHDLVDQLKDDGAKVEDTKKIESQLKKKIKEVSAELRQLGNELWKYASTKKTQKSMATRSIALGALLYFINPFDLIPDSIPVVGYLDDFAVMTLALTQIHKISKDPA